MHPPARMPWMTSSTRNDTHRRHVRTLLLMLLAMHERDRDNGLMDAPWPPVYPKMPDEPPRVQPSKKNEANWETDADGSERRIEHH